MAFPLSRRRLMAAGAAVAGSSACGTPASAQAPWPNRPVRLVVGFTAGSSTDVTARIFAQRFSEAWAQPVVVENIAGNGGAIGLDRVAKSAPDGYTLIWAANGALTVLPSLQTLPFDPLKDLVSIGLTLSMPSLILVNPGQALAKHPGSRGPCEGQSGQALLRDARRGHAAAHHRGDAVPPGRHPHGAYPLSWRQPGGCPRRCRAGRHPE